MFSLYKHEQAGEKTIEVPELCRLFDVGKTKLYEILRGGKYKKEDAKPARRVVTTKVEEPEEPSSKKAKTIPSKGKGKKST